MRRRRCRHRLLRRRRWWRRWVLRRRRRPPHDSWLLVGVWRRDLCPLRLKEEEVCDTDGDEDDHAEHNRHDDPPDANSAGAGADRLGLYWGRRWRQRRRRRLRRWRTVLRENGVAVEARAAHARAAARDRFDGNVQHLAELLHARCCKQCRRFSRDDLVKNRDVCGDDDARRRHCEVNVGWTHVLNQLRKVAFEGVLIKRGDGARKLHREREVGGRRWERWWRRGRRREGR